jgi:hypothetical protein
VNGAGGVSFAGARICYVQIGPKYSPAKAVHYIATALVIYSGQDSENYTLINGRLAFTFTAAAIAALWSRLDRNVCK